MKFNEKYLLELVKKNRDAISNGLDSLGYYNIDVDGDISDESLAKILDEYIVKTVQSEFEYDFGVDIDTDKLFKI